MKRLPSYLFIVLGLGLISCPKQTVSNDAYVCILASDISKCTFFPILSHAKIYIFCLLQLYRSNPTEPKKSKWTFCCMLSHVKIYFLQCFFHRKCCEKSKWTFCCMLSHAKIYFLQCFLYFRLLIPTPKKVQMDFLLYAIPC